MLRAFDPATFSYEPGSEEEMDAGSMAMGLISWGMKKDKNDRKDQPPRVGRLSRRGTHDALEAFQLMKRNDISGQKVTYWMCETQDLANIER